MSSTAIGSNLASLSGSTLASSSDQSSQTALTDESESYHTPPSSPSTTPTPAPLPNNTQTHSQRSHNNLLSLLLPPLSSLPPTSQILSYLPTITPLILLTSLSLSLPPSTFLPLLPIYISVHGSTGLKGYKRLEYYEWILKVKSAFISSVVEMDEFKEGGFSSENVGEATHNTISPRG